MLLEKTTFISKLSALTFTLFLVLTTSSAYTADYSSSPTSTLSQVDTVIEQKIKKQFEDDPRISSPSATVNSSNGVVSLIGNFADKAEVAAAIEIIASTPGVVNIDVSNVTLSTGIDPKFNDLVIESRIKGLYIREKAFDPLPINVITVESNDGVVFLTGAVNDSAQRERAIELARTVPNVIKVIPNIKVKF